MKDNGTNPVTKRDLVQAWYIYRKIYLHQTPKQQSKNFGPDTKQTKLLWSKLWYHVNLPVDLKGLGFRDWDPFTYDLLIATRPLVADIWLYYYYLVTSIPRPQSHTLATNRQATFMACATVPCYYTNPRPLRFTHNQPPTWKESRHVVDQVRGKEKSALSGSYLLPRSSLASQWIRY